MGSVLEFLRRTGLSVFNQTLFLVLVGIASILRALPSRWVLALTDRLGEGLYYMDTRGRKVGRDNLRAVFGDGLTRREKREILQSSFRSSVRSILLLLHASPLTEERYRKWVDIPDEVGERLREECDEHGTGVLVSGHIGSWELLLGLPNLFPTMPKLMFLAERLDTKSLDRFFAHVRGSGGGASVLSAGGARALNSHVRKGGAAALLVDRNVRRLHGGIWVPFLGLEARTTPLPAWLALRNHVPVVPVLCLPIENGRYRIWVGPDLTEGVPGDEPEAALLEITRRFSAVLERVIRERPEIWNWTLKRFKSRPTRELGPYPPYSLWDPDPEPAARPSARP